MPFHYGSEAGTHSERARMSHASSPSGERILSAFFLHELPRFPTNKAFQNIVHYQTNKVSTRCWKLLTRF